MHADAEPGTGWPPSAVNLCVVTAIREPLAEANAFHQQHGWCLPAAERATLEALQRNTVNALSQLFATGRGTGMRSALDQNDVLRRD